MKNIKAFIDFLQYLFYLPFPEKKHIIRFLIIKTILILPQNILILLAFSLSVKKPLPNTYISINSLLFLKREINEMKHYSCSLKNRINDLKIAGVRSWEYGLLLSLIKDKAKGELLDVGSGKALFSKFLASKGWNVTAFDLEDSLEKYNSGDSKVKNFDYKFGNMLNLPFPDNKFDFVTSFSAIEHLGYDQYSRKLPSYEILLKDTKEAIKEMCRVIKKEGYLYLTTDMFISEKQKIDRGNPDRDLGEVYRINDWKEVFLRTLEKNGINIISNPELDENIVIKSDDRSNYRGRYFSTFAIFGQKRNVSI